jgi:ribosome-binding factor A
MREFQRIDRLGAELRRELAEVLRDEVRDPRLGLVTIQEVRVARDMAHAKVYFTCMGADPAATARLLNRTLAGFLRHGLARRVRVRAIPELHFAYDESVERGAHLTDLIEQAVADEHKP